MGACSEGSGWYSGEGRERQELLLQGKEYRREPRCLHRLMHNPGHSHSCTPGQRHTCDLRNIHGHSPHMNMGLHVDTETDLDVVLHPHTVTHTGPAPHTSSAVLRDTDPLRHYHAQRHPGPSHTQAQPSALTQPFTRVQLHADTAQPPSPHGGRHN